MFSCCDAALVLAVVWGLALFVYEQIYGHNPRNLDNVYFVLLGWMRSVYFQTAPPVEK